MGARHGQSRFKHAIENPGAEPPQKPLDTRARLIAAARTLFAERGYQNATVREIAARANTNLASINYHFRTKDDLYRAVLRDTLTSPLTDAPRPVPEAADRDTRLEQFIRAMIFGIVDDGTNERSRLLAWELLRPTGLVAQANDVEILPFVSHAIDVARAFAPPDVDADLLTDIALWLIGQCLLIRRTGRNNTASINALSMLAARGLRCFEGKTPQESER